VKALAPWRLPVLQRRTLALAAALLPLLALLAYVALRSGPLAPVAVTTTRVESRALAPQLFGVGTVAARYVYRIGPTYAGRVRRLDVQVGDPVTAGQVLGEMDPVDLDERLRAQESASRRAEALLREASARREHARAQAQRYERLLALRATSEEAFATLRQEMQVAEAALEGAREERERARADLQALRAQRANLRLVAPVDGIVAERAADPGTTVVAGQPVVELIDPATLWIDVRFDQARAAGLAPGRPARIALRSRDGAVLHGRVLRVEPKADVVTEETLAKIVFDELPAPLPPVGELAEVTVDLAAMPPAPVVPNAAVRRNGARVGVWRSAGDRLEFAPVELGRTDLDGNVQVLAGLAPGEHVVLHSEKALGPYTRVHVVERIAGTTR